MRIDKLSNNYTPAIDGIRFGIDTESDTPQDINVEIVDASTDEVVATKLLRDTLTATINIAPYIRSVGGYSPSTMQQIGFREVPTAAYKIRIGEVESEEIRVSVNRCEVGALPAVITDTPLLREIAQGENDEVMVVVPTGSTIYAEVATEGGETHYYEYTPEGEVASVVISAADLALEDRNFEVTLLCDGSELCTLRYRVATPLKRAVRLAWIAESGAIERYTFPMVSKTNTTLEKQSFMGEEGIHSVRSRAKQTLSLCSRFEPRAKMEALSQIATSPMVWIEQEGEWQTVEVPTSQVEYNLFGEPNYISLEVSLWQKEASIW